MCLVCNQFNSGNLRLDQVIDGARELFFSDSIGATHFHEVVEETHALREGLNRQLTHLKPNNAKRASSSCTCGAKAVNSPRHSSWCDAAHD